MMIAIVFWCAAIALRIRVSPTRLYRQVCPVSLRHLLVTSLSLIRTPSSSLFQLAHYPLHDFNPTIQMVMKEASKHVLWDCLSRDERLAKLFPLTKLDAQLIDLLLAKSQWLPFNLVGKLPLLGSAQLAWRLSPQVLDRLAQGWTNPHCCCNGEGDLRRLLIWFRLPPCLSSDDFTQQEFKSYPLSALGLLWARLQRVELPRSHFHLLREIDRRGQRATWKTVASWLEKEIKLGPLLRRSLLAELDLHEQQISPRQTDNLPSTVQTRIAPVMALQFPALVLEALQSLPSGFISLELLPISLLHQLPLGLRLAHLLRLYPYPPPPPPYSQSALAEGEPEALIPDPGASNLCWPIQLQRHLLLRGKLTWRDGHWWELCYDQEIDRLGVEYYPEYSLGRVSRLVGWLRQEWRHVLHLLTRSEFLHLVTQ